MHSTWFIASSLQACLCDNVIYCRNIHISLCGNGCSWHWNVESDQIKVLFLSYYSPTQSYYSKLLIKVQIIQFSFKLLYIEMDVMLPCMLNCLPSCTHHMCFRKLSKSFDSIECNQENCNFLRPFSQHLNQTNAFSWAYIWQTKRRLVVIKWLGLASLRLISSVCCL